MAVAWKLQRMKKLLHMDKRRYSGTVLKSAKRRNEPAEQHAIILSQVVAMYNRYLLHALGFNLRLLKWQLAGFGIS
jgi:hypothetical protein